MSTPFKLAITGAHSTGKSTFLDQLEGLATGRGLRVGRIGGLARRARDFGWPILADHTVESTLWIMAEGLRQEAELSRSCDVILVDRPPLDALAYLKAGLLVSGRSVRPERLERLHDLARLSTEDYDFVVLTLLDPAVALGAGRDQDVPLRLAADRYVGELVAAIAPTATPLRHGGIAEVLTIAEQAIGARPSS